MKTIVDWVYNEIKKKGNLYPEIYWSMENNGSAEGFICALREIERQNNGKQLIKNATLINEADNKRMGFTTTKVSKATASSQFKILFETNRLHIYSRDFLVQLSNFSLKDITKTSFSDLNFSHSFSLISSFLIIT